VKENHTNMNHHDVFLKPKSLRIERQYWEIINNFSIDMMNCNTTSEIVWGIINNLISKVGFEDCVVYLIDEKREVLVQVAAHGPKNPRDLEILDPIEIPVGAGIVGAVAKSGKSEIIADTRKDKRYIEDDANRLSEITVPIVFENKVLGVIDSENSKLNFFTSEHLDLLTTISHFCAIKLTNAKVKEKLDDYYLQLEKEVEAKTSELQITIEKLTQSNNHLESFAYAASHDLKQPLKTINGLLDLLEKKDADQLSETGKDLLQMAKKGGDRMENLLDGLLQYSRLGYEDIPHQIVDISFLLEDISLNINNLILQNKAVISFSKLPKVYGNKTQLTQLFQNLLINAIKFKKRDTFPEIKIEHIEKNNSIEFRVIDNGIGIKKEYQNTVFNLFNRLNTNRQYEGSGIGLTLCKRIVEYHNGKIWVNSVVGEGTTFYFTLPLVQ